jgi:hypothetical protein
MVSRVGLQNQADYGLSVAPQNRWREVSVGHVSRSSCLIYLETSHARVSQYGLQTGRGATTGGSMRWAASDPSTRNRYL